MEEDTANNFHDIANSHTGVAGAIESLSVFARPDERSIVSLDWFDFNSGFIQQWFDISAGTILSSAVTPGPETVALLTSSIETFTGGWFRLKITVQTRTNTNRAIEFGPALSDGVSSYAGTTGFGAHFWGAQVETDVPFISSYIPTTASAVTRQQDKLTYPALDNLPNVAPGTVVCDGDIIVDSTATNNMESFVDTRSGVNFDGISIRPSPPARFVATVETNTTQAQIVPGIGVDDLVPGVLKNLALAFDTDDVEFFTSKVSRGTDVSAAMPANPHTRIAIGMTGSDGALFGHISSVCVRSTRLLAIP